MSVRPCRQCGSRSFRADRSLAGRLVCTRCGTPQGQGGGGGGGSALRRSSVSVGRLPFWAWIAVGVLVVIVVLPALFG
ncbi:TFIIB-type zinc finger domain-containing protein [Parasynechococcus sp.]|uniref:TFIIB-type zinc finger domain-containing protein n=1 Tax=Parasynechococcus sp. TaxID=3101203 RepID=UPI003703D614